MRTTTRRSALAAGTIAVIAIAGCGNGDGAGASRAEFVDAGNAICSDAKRDIGRATRQSLSADQPPSAAELTEFARETIIPRLERQLDELGRLPVPAGDEREVKEIVGSVQSALDQSRKQPLRFGLAKDSPYAKPDRLARNYGLTECVSG